MAAEPHDVDLTLPPLSYTLLHGAVPILRGQLALTRSETGPGAEPLRVLHAQIARAGLNLGLS